MVPLAQGYLGYLVLSCGTTPTTMQFYLYYPITSNCRDSFISYFSKVQSFTNKSLSLLTRIFIFRSKHFFQSLFCFIICCCPCKSDDVEGHHQLTDSACWMPIIVTGMKSMEEEHFNQPGVLSV